MSGREERPGKRRRSETRERRRPSPWRLTRRVRPPPQESIEEGNETTEQERAEPHEVPRDRGVEAVEALLERIRRGPLPIERDDGEEELSYEERDALLAERRAMRDAIEGRGRPLGMEIIEFVQARPEVYTLPIAPRALLAVAEMLAPEEAPLAWNYAARLASERLNTALTECETDEEYETLQEDMERRLTPPPPSATEMEEMLVRAPVEADLVVEFINERRDVYGESINLTTLLGVIELLGLNGSNIYMQLLVAESRRRLDALGRW